VNFDRGDITSSGENGRKVSLTKNEMIIFKLLLEHVDTIVSRDQIMTVLWDNEEYLNDNALTVNISRLRTKLSELGFEDVIETKKKMGYMLLG
jgi:DNA-binding response OmpR family regulator